MESAGGAVQIGSVRTSHLLLIITMRVSDHAVKRFAQRIRNKPENVISINKQEYDSIRRQIELLFRSAKKIEENKYKFGSFIFVVKDNTILTVYSKRKHHVYIPYRANGRSQNDAIR